MQVLPRLRARVRDGYLGEELDLIGPKVPRLLESRHVRVPRDHQHRLLPLPARVR